MSKAFCTTLQNLGGDPHFEPEQNFLRSQLQHLPSCPPDLTHSDLPQLFQQRFLEILKSSKPTKRGGTDGSSLYMFHLSLEYILDWILFATNCYPPHLMPEQFSESQVFLLCKKGDKRMTNNYRPISLLS